MFLKLMPRNSRQLFSKISLPAKLFLFVIYAFAGDSFKYGCTSQEHNAILFHARGKVSILSAMKKRSHYSEKKRRESGKRFFPQ